MDVHFFLFKQKTAYELRMSDLSSDVCSSDLTQLTHQRSSIPQAAFEDNLAVAECMNGHAPNQGRLAVGRQAEEIRSVVNFPRPLQAAASFIPMIAGRVEIMF